MSNIAAIYGSLPRRLEQWAFSDRIVTPIRRARHGDSSGVRGAAWLGRDRAPAAAPEA
jgi:fructokinase